MGFPVPSFRARNLAVQLSVLSSRLPIPFLPLPLTPATPEFRSESLPLRAPLARRCTHSLRCARQIPANKLPALLNYKSWGSSASRHVFRVRPYSHHCRVLFLRYCARCGGRNIFRSLLFQSRGAPPYPPATLAAVSPRRPVCESSRWPFRVHRAPRQRPSHISPALSFRDSPSR